MGCVLGRTATDLKPPSPPPTPPPPPDSGLVLIAGGAQLRAGASRPAAPPAPQRPARRGEGASGRGLRCAHHRGRARGSPSWPGAMVHARGSRPSWAAGQTPRAKGGGATQRLWIRKRVRRAPRAPEESPAPGPAPSPAPSPAPGAALLIEGPEIGASGPQGKAGWDSI